jgi:hypothetical protein
MVVGKEQESSLRPGRSELTVLAWAFGISLAIHLLTYGAYNLGKQLGWWQNLSWPAWLKKAKISTVENRPTRTELQPYEQVPTLFVETTPRQAVVEAPKNTKFYSDKNTAAANPEADKETEVPKINGKQTQVVKTEDAARNKNMTLMPTLPAPEQRSKPKETSGDLAFAKPNEAARDDRGKSEHSRPRTLAEAQAQNAAKIPGEKMKQDGGVKRHLDFASLDAKATPFGAYDAAFIEAVEQRWFDLLDGRGYAQGSQGRVTLEFRLKYDGRVIDMNVVENTAGEVLGLFCQKAVLDPAPFAAWPSDMRRMLGDTRQIRFTFYYN